MSQIHSDDINVLIYRYLLESGFLHAAFTFGQESRAVDLSENLSIPHGLLVSYIQKGLMFQGIEQHIRDDGTEKICDNPFSLLKKHVCKKRTSADSIPTESSTSTPGTSLSVGMDAYQNNFNSNSGALILSGHCSEVYKCAWNPLRNLLASSSGDTTARVWHLKSYRDSSRPLQAPIPIVLPHDSNTSASHVPFYDGPAINDITTLQWANNGTKLATGSWEGIQRIWNYKGKLMYELHEQNGPLFALKWNKDDSILLSASADEQNQILAYNIQKKTFDKFNFHQLSAMDVDWKDKDIFASCGKDRLIYVVNVRDSAHYLNCFQGHTNVINLVKWRPDGQILASCSDDASIKLWKTTEEKPIRDFTEHTKEVYMVKWSPTGPQTENPNASENLASASFDNIVKIWDIETGSSIHTFQNHSGPVYSIDYSPDGQYLVSGAFDSSMCVWDVKTGELVRRYSVGGRIFDASWNATGDKIACCSSDSRIYVVDFRM